MKKNIHIIPHNGDWAIKKEGNERATKVLSTQKEAIEIGKNIAKDNASELLIHGQNGRIREKNSYGNDQSKTKG